MGINGQFFLTENKGKNRELENYHWNIVVIATIKIHG